jgi:hypothetical protein
MRAKIPHAGHALVSIRVLLFYFIASGIADGIPCCLSDIVYPLLFVRKETELPMPERQEVAS